MPRMILIVDDIQSNRLILSAMLRRDYDILQAASGQEALDTLSLKHSQISAVLLDISMPGMDGFEVLRRIRSTTQLASMPVIMITGSEDEDTRIKSLALGANDFVLKPYSSQIIKHCLHNNIALREASVTVSILERDRLTGVWNREAFFQRAAKEIEGRPAGFYILACLDIEGFKVVNDQYGSDTGDRILKALADALQQSCNVHGGLCGRIFADQFVGLYPRELVDNSVIGPSALEATLRKSVGMDLTISVGRYLVDDKSLGINAMFDRAAIAKSTIKGRFDTHVAVYDESMRNNILREQKIVNEMNGALAARQFEVWYQPQYNRATDAMIGAEALVRWRHPESGLVGPDTFIPIFERNGFIYNLDKFVWEEVCANQRKWLDEGRAPLPISVNISRYDMLRPDLIQTITALIDRYRLPHDLLRLEITETAFSQSARRIVDVVRELVEIGFTVEIDDFGSGYSSLNTLKDVPAQIIKLDMKFLESTSNTQRGGNIVESVVRMAKWLDMSVIAEGVETIQQADYLRSIGCSYIQGYLYAKPMPLAQYEAHCQRIGKEERLLALETVTNLDNNTFWDPNSMDTLIFNSYVGGACIFEYRKGKIELLRATEKYMQVIGSAGMTVEEALKLNWSEHMDEENSRRVVEDLEISAATRKEVTGEYEFLDLPNCPHVTYLRSTMRVIASAGERCLVYCTNENITAQRQAERQERGIAERMQAVMDNVGSGISAAVVRGEDAEILFVNDRYFDIIGYTREQFAREAKSIFSPIHPEDRPRVLEAAKQANEAGKTASMEYRVVRRNGTEAWVKTDIVTRRFEGVDQPVQVCVFSDISLEKKAQRALMETDEQLRFLNDMSHELLAQPDANQGITSALKKLMEYFRGIRAYLFEFDFDRNTASNTYEVCAEGTTREIDSLQNVPLPLMTYWLRAFERNGFYAIEDIQALDDSRAEEREILLNQHMTSLFAVPLKRDGALIGMIGVDAPQRALKQIDRLAALGDYISVMLNRRDLNARIRSDNAALNRMMSDMPGGFCRLRLLEGGALETVYINDGMVSLTGMSREQLMALSRESALEGVHPDDVAVAKDVIARMLQTGEAHGSRYRLAKGSGGYIWLSVFGRTSRDASGETYLNLYYTDASEQVREEETQKTLMDNLPCGAGVYEFRDGKMSLTYQNKRYWELVGLNDEAYPDSAPMSAVYPDDIPIIMRELSSAIAQGRDVVCDIRLRHLDQGYRPVRLVGRIVVKEAGRFLIYATFTPSDTGALSYQQMLPVVLSAIMESTTDLSFAKGKDFRYLTASRAFANMVGQKSETDVIGKTDYDLFGKEMADKFRGDDMALMESGKAMIDMVETIPSGDGAPHYSCTSKYLLRDAAGEVIGLYGVGRDVTKAVAQDTQLKLVNDSVPGGIATYAVRGERVRIVYCNDGFCRLFGGTMEGLRKRGEIDPIEWVHPEDRRALRSQIDALVRDGTPIDCIFRVRVIGGGDKWISEKAAAAERRDGQVLFNAMLLDITERQNAIEKLRISEEENRLALLHGGNIVCRYDVAEKSLTVSSAAAAVYGIPEALRNVPEEPVRMGMISRESAEAYTAFFQAIQSGGKAGSVLYAQRYLGDWRWIEAKSSTIFAGDGRPVRAVISLFDVTDRLEKEAVYRKWQQSLQDRSPASYTLYRCNLNKNASYDTKDGTLIDFDFFRSGSNFQERARAYAQKCVCEEDRDRYIAFVNADAMLAAYYRGKRSDEMEYRERTPDGDCRWLRLTVDLVEYPNSTDVEAYLMYEDIDAAKKAALTTKELSETDPLTGILNRAAFAARVDHLLASSGPEARHALMMLDIDGFKRVNDVFGHSAGDQALIEIADGLRAAMRRNDLVGRLGGDEFVALITDIPDREAAVRKAKQICALARRSYSMEVRISGSVGIAISPSDGKNFEALYRKADAALYFVKGSGKDSQAVYETGMADQHLAPEADSYDASGTRLSEKKRRMLIVDDNSMDHTLLGNIFAGEFIIEKATDGNAALIRLRHYGSAISVVLLDLIMPGMSGFAVLEAMRERDETRGIPVIIVSGDDSREACLTAIRKGATDFIAKPVDADILRLRVRSAISRSENERLKAKNLLLEARDGERIRYESALEGTGIAFVEFNRLTGAFIYDSAVPRYLPGRFDGRDLWTILREDGIAEERAVQRLKKLVQSVAEDRDGEGASEIVTMRTASGKTHRFRASVRKPAGGSGLSGRIMITLDDLDYAERHERN